MQSSYYVHLVFYLRINTHGYIRGRHTCSDGQPTRIASDHRRMEYSTLGKIIISFWTNFLTPFFTKLIL